MRAQFMVKWKDPDGEHKMLAWDVEFVQGGVRLTITVNGQPGLFDIDMGNVEELHITPFFGD